MNPQRCGKQMAWHTQVGKHKPQQAGGARDVHMLLRVWCKWQGFEGAVPYNWHTTMEFSRRCKGRVLQDPLLRALACCSSVGCR